jgi:AcrR family transcriptional regulator
MGTKSSATRERILRQGLELMSQQGVSGVTLGQMAERAGMSKSGLFAHFRSKDDVQIDLLDYMARFAAPCVIEPAMREPEGLPRLASLVHHWLGWAERAGLPGGCPVAAAMFELDDRDGPVRDKVVALEAEWRSLLRRLVRQAIEQGHLRDDLDVDQFVWELCGIYLSHHTSRRFLRHADSDARARTAFEALVERGKPTAGKGERG